MWMHPSLHPLCAAVLHLHPELRAAAAAAGGRCEPRRLTLLLMLHATDRSTIGGEKTGNNNRAVCSERGEACCLSEAAVTVLFWCLVVELSTLKVRKNVQSFPPCSLFPCGHFSIWNQAAAKQEEMRSEWEVQSEPDYQRRFACR